MELNMINPHIRFARNIKNALKPDFLKAVDYHFYYMLSEHCTLIIGSTEYSLTPGTIVIIPPGMQYLFRISSAVEVISINFDYTQSNSHILTEVEPGLAQNFDNSFIIEKINFPAYPFLNEPIVLENMTYLYDDINTILTEFSYKKQFYSEVSSAFFKNILLEIIRQLSFGNKGTDCINAVLDYIHTHYREDINNDDLSSVAGYHPYHLNRLMKASTGTTLRQYIINYRIDSAKRCLRETNIQISKIAELCGYKNFSNFSNDFKRKTGLSPSVYRLQTQHLL